MNEREKSKIFEILQIYVKILHMTLVCSQYTTKTFQMINQPEANVEKKKPFKTWNYSVRHVKVGLDLFCKHWCSI